MVDADALDAPATAVVPTDQAEDGCPLEQLRAGGAGGPGKRREHPARVDALLGRHRDGEPQGRRQRRLEPAGSARAQPHHIEAELTAKGELTLQR